MSFLEHILATKREEVARLRAQGVGSDSALLKDLPPVRGFAKHLETGTRLSIVAEVKQASPSKGLIARDFDPRRIARSYEQAGAAAVSVLTDASYFRGSLDDLRAVRDTVALPVLRKDFVIDERQLFEARVAGADAVLLICAALDRVQLAELAECAHSYGLDVLIEVHSVRELDAALAAKPSVLGVNNRDLETFDVRLETTHLVAKELPANLPFIAESGVLGPAEARQMAAAGACGLLVGEALMRSGEHERGALLDSLRVTRRVPAHTARASHEV